MTGTGSGVTRRPAQINAYEVARLPPYSGPKRACERIRRVEEVADQPAVQVQRLPVRGVGSQDFWQLSMRVKLAIGPLFPDGSQ